MKAGERGANASESSAISQTLETSCEVQEAAISLFVRQDAPTNFRCIVKFVSLFAFN